MRVCVAALLLAAPTPPGLAAADPGFEPPPAGVTVRWAGPRGRKLAIKAAPRRSARTLGEVWAGDEVVVDEGEVVAGARAARGCRRWLRALPEGYLCADDAALRRGPFPGPAGEPPRRFRYAVVRSPEAVVYLRPGTPARPARVLHRGDGVTVVLSRSAAGYVRTTSHSWLRRDDLALSEPSRLRGRELRGLQPGEAFRLGWLVPDRGAESVPLHVSARLAAARAVAVAELRPLPRYTEVVVLSEGRGRAAVLVPPGGEPPGGGPPAEPLRGEVELRHLRRVLPAPPPADLAPGERWIDVSLGQQVLVAYEGREPVFATLVSTAPHGGTPPGSYTIYRKYRSQTMANLAGARALYDFRQVPHAQFFHGRFGLHAALWHDQLGDPVSHGCVNLSPADAERLFLFTAPALPPGWHAMTAAGTRVVVRR